MSIWDYNIKAIIKDIIFGKLSIKSIKSLIKIAKFVENVESGKIKPKDILKFKPEDIRGAIKFHNTYIVKGEKFNADFVLGKINSTIFKLNEARNTHPEIASAISALVSKRANRK